MIDKTTRITIIIPARRAILRSSLVMKGYGFVAALAAGAAALDAGVAVTDAASRNISGAAAVIGVSAAPVPCRIIALLFLL
jgi:hypothetical protein